MSQTKTVATNNWAPIKDDTMKALELSSQAAAEAFTLATSGEVNIGAQLAVADAIYQLRTLLDQPEVRLRIQALQDSPLGFRTDKDPTVWDNDKSQWQEPYEYPIVRDACLEAMMNGMQLCGNHFNIIAKRYMAVKAGIDYQIGKIKAVTDFEINLGLPKTSEGGAIVECDASWKQNGQVVTLKATIPAKLNKGQGADQALGKAERKLLARCYKRITKRNNIVEEEPEGTAGGKRIEDATAAAGSTATRLAGAKTEPIAKVEVMSEKDAAALAKASQKPPPANVTPPKAPNGGSSVPARPAAPPADTGKGELFSDEPFDICVTIMTELKASITDLRAVLVVDKLMSTEAAASIKAVNDVPVEMIKRYAGRDGSYEALAQSLTFVISRRLKPAQ